MPHYHDKVLNKHGILVKQKRPRTLEETHADFLAKIDRSNPNGCHPWLAAKRTDGYGAYRYFGKLHATHRIAWTIFNGPIPSGMCVLHKCDNKPCCNPAHLVLGTLKDNSIDCAAKERGVAKLTTADVLVIRQRIASGEFYHVIAKDYGVTKGAIAHISTRFTWGWLGRKDSESVDAEG